MLHGNPLDTQEKHYSFRSLGLHLLNFCFKYLVSEPEHALNI